MSTLRFILATVAFMLPLSQAAPAAILRETCLVTGQGEQICVIHFEGVIVPGDAQALDLMVQETGVTTVLIDSPGGSAFEGLLLNEVATKRGLRTIAGASFGAWSAAAMLWLGGSQEFEKEETAIVGMHWAYVPGMPEANTDFINSLVAITVYESLGRGRNDTYELLFLMELARTRYGNQGFAVRTEGVNWEVEDLNQAVIGSRRAEILRVIETLRDAPERILR